MFSVGEHKKGLLSGKPPVEDEEERRRGSGLLSNLGMRIFGDDNRFFGTQEDGTTFRDRMLMAGMHLQGEGRGALAVRQGIQQQQAAQAEAQRHQEESRRQRNQIMQQGSALGLQGRELSNFMLLPEDVRNEMLNRHYNPEQPDLPSSVREYEYARQQGFGGSFQDWQAQNPRGTSVNVNTGPQADPRPAIGSIPQGFQARYDDQAESYVYEPIPGSDPAQERERVERAGEEAENRERQYAGIALDEISRATSILDQNPRAGGFIGGLMQNLDGTLSNELEGLYDTIGGYIARDTLQGMRDSSPTGGALGQVTERELSMLRAAYGAIRVGDRPETQRYNLMRLNNMLMDVVHGEGRGPRQDGGAGGSGGLTPEEQRELEELRAWSRSRGQ